MSEKVGFIGLGIMGRGMVDNLMQAGYDVTVWNRTAGRMDPFVERGASAADSPKAVAENCDIIIICVSDTPDVEAVILGDDGVIHGASAGDLVIDMSTINPVNTVEIAKQLNAKGVSMLDAPISGGSEGAAKGTLSIMIGGSDEDVARANPYFEAMGSTITHVGESGAGQTVKALEPNPLRGQYAGCRRSIALCASGRRQSGKDVASGDRRRGRQLDAGQSRSAGYPRLLGAGLLN